MMGLAILLMMSFLPSMVIISVRAMARPKPAVIWMNILAPVLWNSSMYSLSWSNFHLCWYSHAPPRMSLTGAMPGRTRPQLFSAIVFRSQAASLSKWLGSVQPKMHVPPMGARTIRFLISTLPIFHGVNRALYSSFICLHFLCHSAVSQISITFSMRSTF